jgi:hypothetical protein
MIDLVEKIFFSTNLQGQVVESTIHLQHSLIMLLLLVGMLSINKYEVSTFIG